MKKNILVVITIISTVLLGVFCGKKMYNPPSNSSSNNIIDYEENTINNETDDEKETENDDNDKDKGKDKDEDEDKDKENDSKKDEKKEDKSEPEVSNELFGKYYSKAEELLKTMTLEEKVGQMFYVRYPTDNNANTEIKNHYPGGYILFGVNFKNQTKDSVIKMIKNNQKNSKIKMLIGVDEEGGTVTRVSSYTAFRKTKFKSPQELWKEGQLSKILTDSKEKSKLLKSLEINMNLVPVVDVPLKSSSFIYARSYGRGAEKTATYTASLIKAMNEDKMISSMKHFPGYGDNVDTHTGIAIDTRPYSTFEKSDFLPFISGIKAGAPTVLVNHNVVNCMDKKLPASLSPEVHRILREQLNFSGLIITDDLAMDAVKKYVENGEAAVQAVVAGNDLIISSSFVKQKKEVINAVKSKKISEKTIDTAVRRILACKLYYGII